MGLSSSVTPVFKEIISLAKKRLDNDHIRTKTQLMAFITQAVLQTEDAEEE